MQVSTTCFRFSSTFRVHASEKVSFLAIFSTKQPQLNLRLSCVKNILLPCTYLDNCLLLSLHLSVHFYCDFHTFWADSMRFNCGYSRVWIAILSPAVHATAIYSRGCTYVGKCVYTYVIIMYAIIYVNNDQRTGPSFSVLLLPFERWALSCNKLYLHPTYCNVFSGKSFGPFAWDSGRSTIRKLYQLANYYSWRDWFIKFGR